MGSKNVKKSPLRYHQLLVEESTQLSARDVVFTRAACVGYMSDSIYINVQ